MKILVRYLPTAEGRAALDAATAEAHMHGAELLLFRHIGVSEGRPAEDVADGRDSLETAARRLRAEGLACDIHWSVGSGAAARALLGEAKRQEIDLIVIGIRRRSAVGKLVLGSDAQEILLQADCPVLAVKAPQR